MQALRTVTPAHCSHIAAYYDYRWERHKCIAFNLLRRGYRQWSEGTIEDFNNLYDDAQTIIGYSRKTPEHSV